MSGCKRNGCKLDSHSGYGTFEFCYSTCNVTHAKWGMEHFIQIQNIIYSNRLLQALLQHLTPFPPNTPRCLFGKNREAAFALA